MRKHYRFSDNGGGMSMAATAHNMADAVSYLMRVSDEAGMHGITKKLGAVRGKLLQIETQKWSQSGKEQGAPSRSGKGGQ
jgi:hypothetical protein